MDTVEHHHHNHQSFADIEVEMKNRGFEFAGKEPLVVFGYDTEEKQFRPTSYRSRDEVIGEYRKKIRGGKKLEVELVDVPDRSHGEESVYVFTRRREEV